MTGDSSLSGASSGSFFARFFGKQPADYRATTVTVDTTAAGASALDGMTSQVIWIEGDVSLDDVTLGSAAQPVILIVNGNLRLTGTCTVNGLVYVAGDLDAQGTPTLYGSLVTAGDAEATGTLKIVYDPEVLNRVATIGRAAKVPGTFRDW